MEKWMFQSALARVVFFTSKLQRRHWELKCVLQWKSLQHNWNLLGLTKYPLPWSQNNLTPEGGAQRHENEFGKLFNGSYLDPPLLFKTVPNIGCKIKWNKIN